MPRINLDEMWAFFDMPAPTSSRSMDQSDPVMQTLKGKLNRQRLLFHPDKNGHPEAEEDQKHLFPNAHPTGSRFKVWESRGSRHHHNNRNKDANNDNSAKNKNNDR